MKLLVSGMVSVTICCVGAVQARAATALLSVKMLPISLAVEAAEAALDACTRQGFKVSVNVVGRDGVPKALLVGDGAHQFTVDFSRRKAYTASIIGVTTSEFQQRLQGMPDGGKSMLASDANMMAVGGGVPIMSNGEVLGAIGVSGAPRPDRDQGCAQSGVDKIEDRLK